MGSVDYENLRKASRRKAARKGIDDPTSYVDALKLHPLTTVAMGLPLLLLML